MRAGFIMIKHLILIRLFVLAWLLSLNVHAQSLTSPFEIVDTSENQADSIEPIILFAGIDSIVFNDGIRTWKYVAELRVEKTAWIIDSLSIPIYETPSLDSVIPIRFLVIDTILDPDDPNIVLAVDSIFRDYYEFFGCRIEPNDEKKLSELTKRLSMIAEQQGYILSQYPYITYIKNERVFRESVLGANYVMLAEADLVKFLYYIKKPDSYIQLFYPIIFLKN